MLGKRRSYAEAVQGRRKTGRMIGLVLVVFVCYEVLSGLFITSYSMQSQAMSPTVLPGQRILATPLAFGPNTLFGKMLGFARPERGDIAVVRPNYAKRGGLWSMLFDSFVRFFTFQLVSPARNVPDGMLSAPILLRVVGLPGDTIQMDDFIFKVKAAGTDQFLTEFELSTKSYDISHSDPPKSWSADLPGSGHMDARVLSKDEYFLAGDNRSLSSDSRLWGSARSDRFLAKAILRYWPPKSFGAF